MHNLYEAVENYLVGSSLKVDVAGGWYKDIYKCVGLVDSEKGVQIKLSRETAYGSETRNIHLLDFFQDRVKMFKPKIHLSEKDKELSDKVLSFMIDAGCFGLMDEGEFVDVV